MSCFLERAIRESHERGKRHCQGCLPRLKHIISGHSTHGSTTINTSSEISDQTHFSVEDSGDDFSHLTISDYWWAPSPSGAFCVKKGLQRIVDPYPGKPHDNCGSSKNTQRFVSGHPTPGSVKNYYGDSFYETHFSIEVSANNSNDMTISDYEWASTLNGVPCVKREIQIISDESRSSNCEWA
ncbi:hypothetical protein AMTR_s00031p00173540 [Amborella trichopoda]|uniref:Uncharacterized protein n=1 Tax=Amborella trichopoda TaxID=13333 RepID=U5D2X3_AMBTC|nr:hypothetical protein AMTR_s00031p00173540 [Amborella trichopoda]